MKYYRDRAALLTGHVKEEFVLAYDDIGDAVAVVGYGTEPAASAYTVRLLLQIQHVCLPCDSFTISSTDNKYL